MLRPSRLLLLTLTLLLGVPAQGRSDAAHGQPSAEDLQRLQDRIQALNQKISAETGNKDALRQEVEAMEKQIADAA